MTPKRTIVVFPNNKLASYIVGTSTLRLMLIVITSLAFALIPILISVFEMNFRNPSITLDAAHDFGYLIQFCLGYPLVIVLMHTYFNSFTNNISDLLESEVFSLSSEKKQQIIKQINRGFESKVIEIASIAFAVAICVLGLMSYILSGDLTWNNNGAFMSISFAGIMIVPVVFFLYYFAASVLFRVFKVYSTVKILFNNDINIQPLHPDKCGGLSKLGAISKSLNVSIVILGIICVSGIYTSINYQKLPLLHIVHIIIVLLYTFVALVAFFIPLRPAMTKMRQSKSTILKDINRGFDILNTKILNKFSKNEEVSDEEFERLNKYIEFYNLADKMPVYPYDLRTVKSFITSFMIPIAMFILEYVVSNYIL